MVRSVWHDPGPRGWLPALVVAAVASVVFMASGITHAQQNQVQPNQLQIFISALDASGAPVTDLRSDEVAMTEKGAPESVNNLKNGRQVLIATPLVNASGGKFQTLVAFSGLSTVLPEWGKEIALSHIRQTNQFRAVIERPGGATGPLNNLGMRLTRPGVNGSVSRDGRFIQ